MPLAWTVMPHMQLTCLEAMAELEQLAAPGYSRWPAVTLKGVAIIMRLYGSGLRGLRLRRFIRLIRLAL